MGRKARRIKRAGSKRNPYERVLIVCEGTKTEPNYFNAIKKELGLTSADIEIDDSSDTTPNALAKRTLNKINAARDTGNPYDKIFCVFDRDRHKDFYSASAEMERHSFTLARSWPCFEYWLLLHFEYTRPDFVATKKRIKSKTCLAKLETRTKKETYIPKYKKNYQHFDKFANRLETAIKNAKKSCQEQKNMKQNPTRTEVYKVIECLMSIRKQNPSAS